MKVTGIVRRIDELGRVVIPKEIRRVNNLPEGTPMEICVDDGGIIFRRYSPMETISEDAKSYAEALYQSVGTPVLITDESSVIASAGLSNMPRKAKLSPGLIKAMDSPEAFTNVKPIAGQEHIAVLGYPVNAMYGACGAVMLLHSETVKEAAMVHKRLVKTAAMFFANCANERVKV